MLIFYLDLILVYHCCERSAEVSKQVLDLNFTLKTLFENLFKDRVVDQKILSSLKVAIGLPLPQRAHDGSTVFYVRLVDKDIKKYVFHETVRAIIMVLELSQEEEGTWPGIAIVFDLNVYSLQHLAKVDLQTVQQFLYYLQEAMFIKVTGIHIINAPSFVDKLMMLVRPFMNKTLMDCLYIHQVGATTLEEHVPISALPKEAGGEFQSIFKCRDDILERMKLNKEFFARETKRRVVESKRPGKPKTITDIFGGIEGSFKKLDID